MARKVIGPTGSRRRRWLYLLCLTCAFGAALVDLGGNAGVERVDGIRHVLAL